MPKLCAASISGGMDEGVNTNSNPYMKSNMDDSASLNTSFSCTTTKPWPVFCCKCCRNTGLNADTIKV